MLLLGALLLLAAPAWAGLVCNGTTTVATLSADSGALTCADATCTLSLWLQTTTLDDDQVVVNKWDSSDSFSSGWIFYLRPYPAFFLKDSGGGDAAYWDAPDATLNDGVWHHVAVVFTTSTTTPEAQTVQLYIDGVAISMPGAINSAYSPGSPPVFLCWNVSGGNYWPGRLDDLRLFQGALPASLIQSLASSHVRGYPVPAPSLLSLPFTECSNGSSTDGVTFHDTSGGAITATTTDGTCDTTSARLRYRGGVW